jgi:hypothetical protein
MHPCRSEADEVDGSRKIFEGDPRPHTVGATCWFILEILNSARGRSSQTDLARFWGSWRCSCLEALYFEPLRLDGVGVVFQLLVSRGAWPLPTLVLCYSTFLRKL